MQKKIKKKLSFQVQEEKKTIEKLLRRKLRFWPKLSYFNYNCIVQKERIIKILKQEREITWAEFSTLDAGVLDYTMELYL